KPATLDYADLFVQSRRRLELALRGLRSTTRIARSATAAPAFPRRHPHSRGDLYPVLAPARQSPFWHNERNFGPFPNRNQTGNLFGLTAIVILACGQDDLRKGRKRSILWGAALALVITAIILNFSRAGIGILVAGSALWSGIFSLCQ